jgi:hypothetical protein
MSVRPMRMLAWLPALIVPVVAASSGLGCELLVNDLNTMLVDGSPDDVTVPVTLDGYHCNICKDVSPEADLDGDEFFPEAGSEDAAAETSTRDAASESSAKEAGGHDAG